MNVNKNASVHIWVEIINHARLLYHVLKFNILDSPNKVFIWIQNLVLQAVDSHHRVCDVNRNPVQCRDFWKCFNPKLSGLKNVLVVTKNEKFVFHPLTHLFFGLASLSYFRITLFEVHLKCLGNVWLKVSQKLHWLFKAIQTLNPFSYCSSLVGFRIKECLVLLLIVWVETEIS